MITLTLLHPIQSTPVQSWTFEHEPVIRIGRSTDNHVILYSAVVSRHHVELRQVNSAWEIVNLGANGTYLDGQQIAQVPVVDGVIIRLARSGPNIQIHLGSSSTHNLAKEKALIQRARPKPELSKEEKPLISPPNIIPPPTDIDPSPPKAESAKNQLQHETVSGTLPPQLEIPPLAASDKRDLDIGKQSSCLHPRATSDMAFCPDCGQPLHTGQNIGEYQVVKTLIRDRIGVTQLVWRGGQSLLLKTLNLEYVSHPDVLHLFEQQAKALLQLQHPNIPHFVDFFEVDGHPYLVMEPVHGQDLRQRVTAQGALTQKEAIALILQVCDVLDYLHQQSPVFVHHDLRPENLICRNAASEGEGVIVTGFLSLNTLKMDTQSTTVGYLAPEQQQGHGSLASDLFALGPILIYLLTGQEPNQFYAHREQGFRLYPEYVPGLVPDLVVVIRRLTNPDPEERYANAKEVAEALSQVYAMLPEKL